MVEITKTHPRMIRSGLMHNKFHLGIGFTTDKIPVELVMESLLATAYRCKKSIE
jgi:hypothetical protein